MCLNWDQAYLSIFFWGGTRYWVSLCSPPGRIYTWKGIMFFKTMGQANDGANKMFGGYFNSLPSFLVLWWHSETWDQYVVSGPALQTQCLAQNLWQRSKHHVFWAEWPLALRGWELVKARQPLATQAWPPFLFCLWTSCFTPIRCVIEWRPQPVLPFQDTSGGRTFNRGL